MAARTIAPAQLLQHVGQEVGVSDWIEVSQSLIDLFAEGLTGPAPRRFARAGSAPRPRAA